MTERTATGAEGSSEASRDEYQPAQRGLLEAEFVDVEEFARRVGVPKQSVYRAIERNQVPGVFRLGRRVTVNWSAFVAKTYEAA